MSERDEVNFLTFKYYEQCFTPFKGNGVLIHYIASRFCDRDVFDEYLLISRRDIIYKRLWDKSLFNIRHDNIDMVLSNFSGKMTFDDLLEEVKSFVKSVDWDNRQKYACDAPEVEFVYRENGNLVGHKIVIGFGENEDILQALYALVYPYMSDSIIPTFIDFGGSKD